MEKAFKDLQDRIAKLEAKVHALPSPEEFAALKSDVEFIKSESAPRATSTAEAALKVAYDMKEELIEKVDNRALDTLRHEVETLKSREIFAAPEQGQIKHVIKHLKNKELMFNPEVIVRASTNDWYESLKKAEEVYMFVGTTGNVPVVDIILKEPVQLNGFSVFRPTRQFTIPVQVSLGEVPFEPTHKVEFSNWYAITEKTVLHNDFETKMVRWVRVELKQQEGDYQVVNGMHYNLELYSPDPMYYGGVFSTLGQRHQDLRKVCNVSLCEHSYERKRGAYVTTFSENAPWAEVEIVHGRMKITGYWISWAKSEVTGWTLRCSNNRDLPIEDWEVVHRYVIGSEPVSLLGCGILLECQASGPMKYFRVCADALPEGKVTGISMRLEFQGTLCPE